ncbi:secreted protein [Streptomyces cinnamoneus]|uniref:Secreted protein n=1 Tax=Streptomyces cinnamoneus TaxID=53446 RepID=A0A918WLF6_STRCJ|nr:secreted protein [Streptomyces cinnamoneus]
MISRVRKTLLAGIAVAATAVVGVSTLTTANAAPQPGAESEIPPYAVEDFAYPNADAILKEKGIKLVQGDGHIMLADCAASTDIQVMTTQSKDFKYCFKVTGKSGYLALEIPSVYGVQTEDHPVKATVKAADGPAQSVDVPKGQLKGVGEGVPGGQPTVLVELRVTG